MLGASPPASFAYLAQCPRSLIGRPGIQVGVNPVQLVGWLVGQRWPPPALSWAADLITVVSLQNLPPPPAPTPLLHPLINYHHCRLRQMISLSLVVPLPNSLCMCQCVCVCSREVERRGAVRREIAKCCWSGLHSCLFMWTWNHVDSLVRAQIYPGREHRRSVCWCIFQSNWLFWVCTV